MAILTSLTRATCYLIDEIHRLPRNVGRENVYRNGRLFARYSISGLKGPSARSIRLDVPHFTLVGATTRSGQLTAPLRDRFGVLLRLELYAQETAQIITRSAGILGIAIERDGALQIASRSRGTPRIANRLLKRVCEILRRWNSAAILPKKWRVRRFQG